MPVRGSSLTSRWTSAAVGVTAVLTLAACGTGPEPAVATTAGAVPGVDLDFSRADVAFISDMKPHHVEALEMAELAATRSTSAEIKDLAVRIVAAQDPEIRTTDSLANAWGVVVDGGTSTMGGMDMGGRSMGDDVAVLKPLTGSAFDRAFLTRMTAHHQSAVKMAEVEVRNGRNAQAKRLADAIIAVQTEEMVQMRVLLSAP